MRIADANSGLAGSRPTASSSSSDFNLTAATTPYTVGEYPSWIEERARVAVNRNVTVAGHLVFQEAIRIEGRFRGEVSSSELVVISEEGSVGGRIRSARLVVLGELEGHITVSESVVLGPRSRFKGTIEAGNLTICEGARLNADLHIRGCLAARRSEAKPAGRSPEPIEGQGVRDARTAEFKRNNEDALRRELR
jgi:cytoskeletal protein CcmA (bactofilin family)